VVGAGKRRSRKVRGRTGNRGASGNSLCSAGEHGLVQYGGAQEAESTGPCSWQMHGAAHTPNSTGEHGLVQYGGAKEAESTGPCSWQMYGAVHMPSSTGEYGLEKYGKVHKQKSPEPYRGIGTLAI